ncbi:GL20976 [Drosophila persimilis]|uniref:GL20976 n=1 Tax=Drosophila persimilis TaxID=7234 RepID=B4IS10_DROPE|nr:GL20976 [Drosophila persimilis]
MGTISCDAVPDCVCTTTLGLAAGDWYISISILPTLGGTPTPTSTLIGTLEVVPLLEFPFNTVDDIDTIWAVPDSVSLQFPTDFRRASL